MAGFPDLGLLRVLRPTPTRSTGHVSSRVTLLLDAASTFGGAGMVPTFIPEPFDGIGTQLCPNIIAMVTPQAFTMASRAATSPTQRVPLATHVARVRNVTRPESARFRVGGLELRGFQPLVPVRIPLRLACRARTIWQYWIRLVVVEDCSTHLARTSEADRPPAITRLLRQTRSGVLSSPRGSRTPRGARCPPTISDQAVQQ